MADEIIKVLDALCEKFGITIDWTSANVMPYLKELCGKYINYEIWTSVAWIVLASVVFTAVLITFIKLHSKAKKEDWDDEFIIVVCIIVLAVIGVVWLGIMIAQVDDIITCLTFPEKMLFEYVQGMLSSSNG